MKRSFRKIVSGLTLLIMLSGCILPATAHAADDSITAKYGAYGTIKEDTYYKVNGSSLSTGDENNFNFYLENTDNGPKLTVKDTVFGGSLTVPGGTTIDFVGENTLGTEQKRVIYTIKTDSVGALTITGEGSFVAYAGGNDSCIYNNNGDIVIDGANLTIDHKNDSAISSENGSVTVQGDAVIKTTPLAENSSTHKGITAKNITIKDQANVTIHSNKESLNAVDTNGDPAGKVSITDQAVVDLTSNKMAAIFAGELETTEKLR